MGLMVLTSEVFMMMINVCVETREEGVAAGVCVRVCVCVCVSTCLLVCVCGDDDEWKPPPPRTPTVCCVQT